MSKFKLLSFTMSSVFRFCHNLNSEFIFSPNEFFSCNTFATCFFFIVLLQIEFLSFVSTPYLSSLFYSSIFIAILFDRCVLMMKNILQLNFFFTFLVQYKQCDQMITIPNLSFKTKKCFLCIFLIVQTLVFMWRQCVYSRFVPSPFVSFILISSQLLILVSKHMYTW